jgi:hypothetical protein
MAEGACTRLMKHRSRNANEPGPDAAQDTFARKDVVFGSLAEWMLGRSGVWSRTSLLMGG